MMVNSSKYKEFSNVAKYISKYVHAAHQWHSLRNSPHSWRWWTDGDDDDPIKRFFLQLTTLLDMMVMMMTYSKDFMFNFWFLIFFLQLTTQLDMMVMMMTHSKGGHVTNQTKSRLQEETIISWNIFNNEIKDFWSFLPLSHKDVIKKDTSRLWPRVPQIRERNESRTICRL